MVNQQIIMPFGWEKRFEPIYKHISGFLRDFGANKHDDPEDGVDWHIWKELADGNIKPYGHENRGVKVRN